MSKRPTFSIDPEKPPVEQINKEYLRLTEKFYAAYNALHVMKTPSRNSRRNATKTVNKFNGSVQMKEAFSLLNKGIAAAIIYDENKPREEQDCCNIVIEKSKLFHYMNEPVKAYNTLADEIERVEALGQEPHGRLYLSLAMIDSAAGRHDEAADWLEQLIDHPDLKGYIAPNGLTIEALLTKEESIGKARNAATNREIAQLINL